MRFDPKDEARFVAALEKGIELFNEQRFFEAYEVWEEQWSEEVTDGADLMQGLLQVAVGFSKLLDGIPKGTVKLLESGAKKLESYAPKAYDLDVAAILEMIEAWKAVAQKMLEQGSAAGIELPKVGIETAVESK